MAEEDLSQIISLFQEFFTKHQRERIDSLSLDFPTRKSLEIDFGELEIFDPELADRLIKEPDLIVDAAKEAVSLLNIHVTTNEPFKPNVRFFNIPQLETEIEELTSKNIHELVSFKGVITRRADVMHRVKIAVYVCELCESEERVPVTKNFSPPKRCPSCKKLALKQLEDQSTFVDIQRAEIQELLEKVRGGAPASHVELLLEDDLVNSFSPGENVEVVGILRIRPPLKTKQKQELVYARYVDVLHVKSMRKDFEEVEITKEDEMQIIELARNPDIEAILRESIAPGIYGHTEVKESIVLQLFGGTKGKTMGGMPIRDDIHILLIGDPGAAKSRFLQSVGMIAPKSIYVSGKSTSGAGLTVAAEKDELGEGGWTLKAGALVLASGGTAQIDEFDKIEEEDRSSLHECMESQTISVAKAGIVAKFKTKAAILAAANPKYGRFDQNKNLGDQFDVPPTLLSRFDLIFPIVDVLDEEKDSRLATHILSAHMGNEQPTHKETVARDLLRKYIAYARRYCFPKLTPPAMERIRAFYVELRRMGKDTGSVPITPRYLEGLVRMAEAHAKIRLSTTVEDFDAQFSIHLLEHVMRQVMTDKETGKFDVDVVATGKPKSERDRLEKVDVVLDIIRTILKSTDSAEIDKVISQAASYDVDENTARKIIQELLRKGELYEKGHGHVKIVGE